MTLLDAPQPDRRAVPVAPLRECWASPAAVHGPLRLMRVVHRATRRGSGPRSGVRWRLRRGLPRVPTSRRRFGRTGSVRRGGRCPRWWPGVPAKVISERLSDATAAFTLQVYAHVIPGMDRQAGDSVAALIFGAGGEARSTGVLISVLTDRSDDPLNDAELAKAQISGDSGGGIWTCDLWMPPGASQRLRSRAGNYRFARCGEGFAHASDLRIPVQYRVARTQSGH